MVSYRTSRSFGYGYDSITELPEVPGIVTLAYIELTEVPGGYERCYTLGIVPRGVQNSQKFRVRV